LPSLMQGLWALKEVTWVLTSRTVRSSAVSTISAWHVIQNTLWFCRSPFKRYLE